MKRVLVGLGALALVGLVGMGVSASGALRFRASGGHWSITENVLHFTTRRSIATWSMGIEVPPLDDPELVVIGAGHYETGCRHCHGRPGPRRPAVALAMTPDPPGLGPQGRHWDPEDLFYVMKHGVKFTGMPAWPDLERDDEIWATVAFLRALPDLDRDGYDALVFGGTDLEVVPDPVRRCVRCHGSDGLGRGVFPRLAGQRPEYVRASLRAFVAHERSSGTMRAAVDGLRDADIEDAARWFADLPRGPAWPMSPGADAAQGEAIARGRAAGIPACAHCHGPGDTPRNPVFPRLDGQDPEYLAAQLRLFRAGTRGGTPFAGLMDAVAAHGLDDARIADVTSWYAAIDP